MYIFLPSCDLLSPQLLQTQSLHTEICRHTKGFTKFQHSVKQEDEAQTENSLISIDFVLPIMAGEIKGFRQYHLLFKSVSIFRTPKTLFHDLFRVINENWRTKSMQGPCIRLTQDLSIPCCNLRLHCNELDLWTEVLVQECKESHKTHY